MINCPLTQRVPEDVQPSYVNVLVVLLICKVDELGYCAILPACVTELSNTEHSPYEVPSELDLYASGRFILDTVESLVPLMSNCTRAVRPSLYALIVPVVDVNPVNVQPDHILCQ